MLLTAMRYLEGKCSVMFFPEGTRSPDSRVHRFADGAFHIAIKAQVPLLPIAIEGSYRCLPKRSWRFGEPSSVHVTVLPEVPTKGMTVDDVGRLKTTIRRMIIEEVARARHTTVDAVDGLSTVSPSAVSSSLSAFARGETAFFVWIEVNQGGKRMHSHVAYPRVNKRSTTIARP